MSDQSKTCYPPNSEDLPNAISSPASESGATPCAKPDGPMTEKSGPAVARANLSARQAKEAGLLTSGTYGPRFITSSESVRLESSLVSRLRVKTASLGSTLFRLTWKQRDTPLGVSISALRASVLRTSGKDCTSAGVGTWQTPKAHDGDWGTPRTSGRPMHRATHLQTQVVALLTNADKTLAPWITPQAKDWRSGQAERYLEGKHSVSLNDQVTLVSGRRMMKSGASMEGRGRLNPAHSRWLQGLPTAWESCADMVTRSVRRSRKASSKPISKRKKNDD